MGWGVHASLVGARTLRVRRSAAPRAFQVFDPPLKTRPYATLSSSLSITERAAAVDTESRMGSVSCSNLALGEGLGGFQALFDVQAAVVSEHAAERWCNQVASELLVPLASFREAYDASQSLQDEIQRLARQYEVSTLVILRRLHDAGFLDRQEMWAAHKEERDRLLDIPRGSGGNFYAPEVARVSERFARAVVTSNFEG